MLIRLASAAIATMAVVGAYYLWAAHVAVSYPPHHFAGEGKFLTLEDLPEWIHERWFLPGFVAAVLAILVVALHRVRRRGAAPPACRRSRRGRSTVPRVGGGALRPLSDRGEAPGH